MGILEKFERNAKIPVPSFTVSILLAPRFELGITVVVPYAIANWVVGAKFQVLGTIKYIPE